MVMDRVLEEETLGSLPRSDYHFFHADSGLVLEGVGTFGQLAEKHLDKEKDSPLRIDLRLVRRFGDLVVA